MQKPSPVSKENGEFTGKNSTNSEMTEAQKNDKFPFNLKLVQNSASSANKGRVAVSSANSSDHYLRKRIHYNDSSLKKGGGGTGLMYGASDKSSSSSAKLRKKGSASSNSTHSVNSNSDKSYQKHFDRLMKRNEIMNFLDFHNENNDSETIQNVITPNKLTIEEVKEETLANESKLN